MVATVVVTAVVTVVCVGGRGRRGGTFERSIIRLIRRGGYRPLGGDRGRSGSGSRDRMGATAGVLVFWMEDGG